jgi:hypothetical protein
MIDASTNASAAAMTITVTLDAVYSRPVVYPCDEQGRRKAAKTDGSESTVFDTASPRITIQFSCANPVSAVSFLQQIKSRAEKAHQLIKQKWPLAVNTVPADPPARYLGAEQRPVLEAEPGHSAGLASHFRDTYATKAARAALELRSAFALRVLVRFPQCFECICGDCNFKVRIAMEDCSSRSYF